MTALLITWFSFPHIFITAIKRLAFLPVIIPTYASEVTRLALNCSMSMKVTARTAGAAVALGVPLLAALLSRHLPGLRSRPDPLPGFPPLILWAWEEAQDLRFLDPSHVGVAYLAETIIIEPNGATLLHPRLQRLYIAPDTKRMAVIRIENRSDHSFDSQILANDILRRQILQGASALQIDYDARRSERPQYLELLRILRNRMPSNMPLTITALVSWCAGDDWIDSLPIAEAIPMYFRMGAQQPLRTAPLRASVCGHSTGLSIDEALHVAPHRRIFLFSPRSWTSEDLHQAIYEIRRQL